MYLFIEIAVTSGCPFVHCLPSRNAKTSANMDSYTPPVQTLARLTLITDIPCIHSSRNELSPSTGLSFRTPAHYVKCSKGLNMIA